MELDSNELRQDQEQGSGAGLSQREGLSLTSGLASGVISYFSESPFIFYFFRRDQEWGGGAGLKRAQARSRAGKWRWTLTERGTIFNFRFSQSLFGHCLVTLLCTAVETAVSGVPKLLGTGGVPTSLTLLFWRRLVSLSAAASAFTGRRAWTSYSCLHLPPPPPPSLPLPPLPPYLPVSNNHK